MSELQATGDSLVRHAETIKIGGGADYAKVVTRLVEMLNDNQECSIETTCEIITDVGVVFRAVVVTTRGTFTGHSFGKIGGKVKQFEKQETIAVGRALAFAGYLASGEIASVEEMSEFSGRQSADESISQKSTSVGIGKAQLGVLASDWELTRRDDLAGLNKQAKWGLFSEWVLDASGLPAPDHHSKWSRVQYDQCLEKIAEEHDGQEK